MSLFRVQFLAWFKTRKQKSQWNQRAQCAHLRCMIFPLFCEDRAVPCETYLYRFSAWCRSTQQLWNNIRPIDFERNFWQFMFLLGMPTGDLGKCHSCACRKWAWFRCFLQWAFLLRRNGHGSKQWGGSAQPQSPHALFRNCQTGDTNHSFLYWDPMVWNGICGTDLAIGARRKSSGRVKLFNLRVIHRHEICIATNLFTKNNHRQAKNIVHWFEHFELIAVVDTASSSASTLRPAVCATVCVLIVYILLQLGRSWRRWSELIFFRMRLSKP